MKYLQKIPYLVVIVSSVFAVMNSSKAQTDLLPDAPAVDAITGFVFRDLNNNGVREQREPGEPNIRVTAYDTDDNEIVSTLSDDSGNYTLQSESILPEQMYIVVFSGWSEPLMPGAQGMDSGTEVQFATGGKNNINFGLQNPDSYVQPESPSGPADGIVISLMYNGRPNLASASYRSSTGPGLLFALAR